MRLFVAAVRGLLFVVAARNRRDIDAGRPVYAVYGSDDFLRTRGLETLLGQLLGDDREGGALTNFEGPSASLADVLDACRTPSLFAARQVVCVLDADDFVKAHRKSLERYLEEIGEGSRNAALLLVCRTWQKTTRLYKLVDQIGVNVGCEPPRRRDGFVAWVQGHAQSAYGCRVAAPVAAGLVELVGENLGLLNMELAKLATYVGDRGEIGIEDVRALVGFSRVEQVFGVAEAIALREVKRALRLWNQVLANDRRAPYLAVGGLGYAFRRLAEAKGMISQGASLGEARSQLKIWDQKRNLGAQLERFSVVQWREHLITLLKIDLGAKSGLGTVESGVEKLIVELCQTP